MRLSSRDESMATAQVRDCPQASQRDYHMHANYIANAFCHRDVLLGGKAAAPAGSQKDFRTPEGQDQYPQDSSCILAMEISRLLSEVHPKALRRVIGLLSLWQTKENNYGGPEKGVLNFMRHVEALAHSEEETAGFLSQLLQHVTDQKSSSLRSLKNLSMLLGLMVGTEGGCILSRWIEGLLSSPAAPMSLKQGVCSVMQMMLQQQPSVDWAPVKEGKPYGVNGRVLPSESNVVLQHQRDDSNAPQTVLDMFANAVPALVQIVKGYSSWGKKDRAQSNLGITAVEVVLMITLNLLDDEGTVLESDGGRSTGEQRSPDDFNFRGVWDEDLGWTFTDQSEVNKDELAEASEVFADGTSDNAIRECSNDAGECHSGNLCGRSIVWRDLDHLIDMVREICQWNDSRGRDLYSKGLEEVLGQLETIAKARDEMASMAGEEELKPLVNMMTNIWKCYGPLLVPSQFCGSPSWCMRMLMRLLSQLEVLGGRFRENSGLTEEMRSNSQTCVLTQLALVLGSAKPKYIAKLLSGPITSKLYATLIKQLMVADERVSDLASSLLHALLCDWELAAGKAEEGVDAVIAALALMEVVPKGVMQLLYVYFKQQPQSQQLQALFSLGDHGSAKRRNALAVIGVLRARCLQNASDSAEISGLSHSMSTIFQQWAGDEELQTCWANAGNMCFPVDDGKGGKTRQADCAEPVSGRALEVAKLKKNEIIELLHASSSFGVGLLNRMLSDVCLRLQPKAEDYARRQAVLHMVNVLITEMDVCEGGVVVPFGSFESNIFTPDGDLDLSLEIQSRKWQTGGFTKSEKVKMLRVIMRALVRSGNRIIDFIPRARVPLISFVERRNNVKCDLSVDNGDALFKSTVMRWICEIDHRCRELIFLVKCWARSHCINDPKMGTLNSYALSQLVIFHLQTCCPPIMPPLSAILGDAGPQLFAGSWSDREQALTSCYNRVQELMNSAFGKDNHSTLADLFSSFFAQFSAVEDLWKSGLCASTYLGTWGDRTSLGSSWSGKQYVMQVEDPFDRSENCARTVQGSLFVRVRNAFRSTSDALSSHFRSVQRAGSDSACMRSGISELQTMLFSPRIPPEQIAKPMWPVTVTQVWQPSFREMPPVWQPSLREMPIQTTMVKTTMVNSRKGMPWQDGVAGKMGGRVQFCKVEQKYIKKDQPSECVQNLSSARTEGMLQGAQGEQKYTKKEQPSECLQTVSGRMEGMFQGAQGAQPFHQDDFPKLERIVKKGAVVDVEKGPASRTRGNVEQKKVAEASAAGAKGRPARQPSASKSLMNGPDGVNCVVEGIRTLELDHKCRSKQIGEGRGVVPQSVQQREAVQRTSMEGSGDPAIDHKSREKQVGEVRGGSQLRQLQEAAQTMNADVCFNRSQQGNGDARGACAGSSDGVAEDSKGKKKPKKSDRRRLRRTQGSLYAPGDEEECSSVRETGSSCAQKDAGFMSSIEKPHGLQLGNPAVHTRHPEDERDTSGAETSNAWDLDVSGTPTGSCRQQHCQSTNDGSNTSLAPPTAPGMVSKASGSRITGAAVPARIPEKEMLRDRAGKGEYHQLRQGQEQNAQTNRLSDPPEKRGRGEGASIPTMQGPPGVDQQQGQGVSLASEWKTLPTHQLLPCSTSSNHTSLRQIGASSAQLLQAQADGGPEVHASTPDRKCKKELATTSMDGQIRDRGSTRVSASFSRKPGTSEANRPHGHGGSSGMESSKRRQRSRVKAAA
ncbi:hypothetical protein CBR_g34900 [Chara braunii]|uniref:Poly(A) RNA polymerase mitochondrial-like central palm domain-containing protein n=1 Tax=Chara braunii TaxID=69332 RepID=A0A388LJU8_CHABU|nr:hypothetical protein CBR_g34900 [Chara braunii]|eukprot:GBG82523.1 hypothetical protein CBR_g34900 [Chara braunii]